LGFRTAVSKKLSIDFASYYNDYKDEQTMEPGAPFLVTTTPLHLVLPLTYGNLMYGETHGLEISGEWKVMRRWRLAPGYAFEEIHMHTQPQSLDTTSVAIAEGSSPRNSAQLRSIIDLPHGLAWSASADFVDRLAAFDIPSYTRVDTQLIWKWGERGTFSLVGQNLQRDHHFEIKDFTQSVAANQIKRSAYAMIRWSF
jgi:outer membrane receptor protein involved in Fe transport